MKYKYINCQSPIPIKKLSGLITDENSGRFSVKEEAKDRIQKLDAHSIWSVTFYFTSQNALKEGINVLAGIGYYYTLFHCIFAAICLDFDIPDEQLKHISHNMLSNLLKKQVKVKVASIELLNLFTDARFVREFANYLSGESGHDKFMSLRHTPRSLVTDSFGKIEFNDFVRKLDSACGKTIDEFIALLKNVENHFSKNIFPVVHRTSDFDYYGEDFLENFFSHDCEIISAIERYLSDAEKGQ